MSDSPQGITRVGVYAACVRNGRILLVHQIAEGPAQNSWHLPGGGLDFGEPPAEGVRREMREEVGCDVEVGQVIAADGNLYTPPDGVERHGIRLIFAAQVIGEPTSPDNDEIDRVGWFPLDDLPAKSTVTATLAAEIVRGTHSTRPN